MDSNSFKRIAARVSTAAVAMGFVLALNGCGTAVEDPPRAMFGTVAWSDGWNRTCNDVDPSDKQPHQYGDEHLNKDCAQYLAAQRMHYRQPALAQNAEH
ncbi:MAG TPA: hypothetical protein VIX12_04510 [Candidatus Binataceae bacterium]